MQQPKTSIRNAAPHPAAAIASLARGNTSLPSVASCTVVYNTANKLAVLQNIINHET
jgi:hypothetical protein